MRLRVAASTLALQFAYGLVFAWGAAAPYVRAHDHWPESLIGAVFSATPLGYGTATILGGRLADRLPPKPLCTAAVALLVAGFAIAFVFPSPYTFVGTYAFLALGLGGGIALTASLGAAVQAFPDRVGSIGGALTGMYALGAVFQVPIVQRLAAADGWLDAVRWTGGGLAALAVVALLNLPSLPAPRRTAGDGHVPIPELLRRPRVWTGILAVATTTPLGAYAFVNAGLFAQSHQLGLFVAGAALIGAAIGNATGRVSGGVLADAIGVDRVLLAIAGIEVAAGILVATGAAGGVVLGSFGAGAALGGGAGVLARMAADSAPDAPHSTFGLLFSGYAAGALTGPLAGPLAGSGPVPWLALAALALPGLALAAVRRRMQADQPTN